MRDGPETRTGTRLPVLEPGRNCWRIEKADRFAVVIDGQAYFRAVKQAILNARQQVIMVGWDFDTRIELEPDEKTVEGPNRLGRFLTWFAKHRPEIDLKLLKWNLGMLESLKRGETPIIVLKWMASRRIDIKLDGAHPLGASHHQKTIAIDDRLALCGGIDLTKGRWDTREHLDDDPNRHSARGDPLGPWHDATACLDGDAARALGEMARTRWQRAVSEDVKVPDCGGDPWPSSVEPDFENVRVAIARTIGAFDDYPQVSEIEALTLDIIASARRMLYIESQYFASRKIAEAIMKRLGEEDGPEIVVVNPQSQDGWLEEKTMGSARARLLRYVRNSDRHNRFRLYYPVTAGRNPVYVHAKIMIADDCLFKIGSANLNNRSMGLDTECDLCIAAEPDDRALRDRIAELRNDLLAEHLGTDRATIAARLDETGLMIATIETFRHEGNGFEELPIRDLDEADEAMGENELMDPERPPDLTRTLKRWIGAG